MLLTSLKMCISLYWLKAIVVFLNIFRKKKMKKHCVFFLYNLFIFQKQKQVLNTNLLIKVWKSKTIWNFWLKSNNIHHPLQQNKIILIWFLLVFLFLFRDIFFFNWVQPKGIPVLLTCRYRFTYTWWSAIYAVRPS